MKHGMTVLNTPGTIDADYRGEVNVEPCWTFKIVPRKLTTWHYHWMIIHEFLPQIVGQTLVDDVLRRGGRFYRPERGEAFTHVASEQHRDQHLA
jgi:hypothetical protein